MARRLATEEGVLVGISSGAAGVWGGNRGGGAHLSNEWVCGILKALLLCPVPLSAWIGLQHPSTSFIIRPVCACGQQQHPARSFCTYSGRRDARCLKARERGQAGRRHHPQLRGALSVQVRMHVDMCECVNCPVQQQQQSQRHTGSVCLAESDWHYPSLPLSLSPSLPLSLPHAKGAFIATVAASCSRASKRRLRHRLLRGRLRLLLLLPLPVQLYLMLLLPYHTLLPLPLLRPPLRPSPPPLCLKQLYRWSPKLMV